MIRLKPRLISEQEARALLAAHPDAEYLPHRVIAASGVTTISNWLVKVARIPQDTIAWITQAEDTANDDWRYDVVIEMRAHSTVSGRPETLHVPEHDFVWYLNEVAPVHTCKCCAGSGFQSLYANDKTTCPACNGTGAIDN